MKNYILAASIAFLSTAVSAATAYNDDTVQPVDTVLCVKNANCVVITENPGAAASASTSRE